MSFSYALEKTLQHISEVKYEEGTINDIGIEIGFAVSKYYTKYSSDFYISDFIKAVKEGIILGALDPKIIHYYGDGEGGAYHNSCKVHLDFQETIKGICVHLYSIDFIEKNIEELGKKIGYTLVKFMGVNRSYILKPLIQSMRHGWSFSFKSKQYPNHNYRELIAVLTENLKQTKAKVINDEEKTQITIEADFADAIFWNSKGANIGDCEGTDSYSLSSELAKKTKDWYHLFNLNDYYGDMINWFSTKK
jgi:hypothetical protein